jgi:hypothetical protein
MILTTQTTPLMPTALESCGPGQGKGGPLIKCGGTLAQSLEAAASAALFKRADTSAKCQFFLAAGFRKDDCPVAKAEDRRDQRKGMMEHILPRESTIEPLELEYCRPELDDSLEDEAMRIREWLPVP